MADFHQVLTGHPRYSGERDLRSLHLLALVQEFGSTCLVAQAEDGTRGYLFGFVTPDGTWYVPDLFPRGLRTAGPALQVVRRVAHPRDTALIGAASAGRFPTRGHHQSL